MLFKVIFRNWKKNATAFVLRLSGLTLSLSFTVVLLVFILHEYSYDNHVKNHENIYRILLYDKSASITNASNPFFPRSMIMNSIPEIKDVCRYTYLNDVFIKKSSDYIPENRFFCADFEIFKNLDIHFMDGDYTNPGYVHYIAISRKISEKYFPDQKAVGSIVTIKQANKELSVIVTAVFENIPENSTFHADIIGNNQILFDIIGKDLNNVPFENTSNYGSFDTYITLKKSCDPRVVGEKLSALLYPAVRNSSDVIRLQNIKDIYFGSGDIANNHLPSGSSVNVKLFILICFLIVLLATSNFAMISAVIHNHRKHEYFIRATYGATRFNTMVLILGEIFLLLLISIILSIVLSTYLWPFVSDIFQKQMSLDKQTLARLITTIAGTLVFIGLCTVLLTGLFIFENKQGSPLQQDVQTRLPFFKWNKLLVFGQIAIFSSLIVVSSILFNQWKFIKSKDALGFDPVNLVVVELPEELTTGCDALINELKLNPQVLNIAEASSVPFNWVIGQHIIFNNDDYSNPIYIEETSVGSDYFKTLGLTIIEGREYDPLSRTDRDNSIIINEAAVKLLGLEEPIGKKVASRVVIGVVKDFPIKSLYEKISPMIYYPVKDSRSLIIARFQGNRSRVIDYIAGKQLELAPVSEPSITDFSSLIDETYKHEKKLKFIFVVFTIIAVILGIFGIIGLLIFTLQKRRKEITIRIIHGASFTNIVFLISKEFLLTLIISNIIAYPFIWYFANNWLNTFTNHIKINFIYFLLGTGSTIIIIITLVSLIVLRHLKQNPIKYINS